MSDSKSDKLKHPSRRLRWLIWPAGVIGVLLAVVYVIGPWAATPIIRGKLDAMVRSQLNARLDMGSIVYDFPYGVRVRDAVLVADDPRGGTVKLLELPSLHIALAKLPFGDGPLVVERILLDQPGIHMIKTADGLLGQKLIRSEGERSQEEVKLSQMFQLRLVSIDEGRIIFEDRTRPDAAPAVWRSIDVRLTTTPTTSPVYAFGFSAVSRPLATVAAAGTFDIDAFYLQAEKLTMEFTAAASHSESPAPAELQRWLADYGVNGHVRLEAKAQVPLKNLKAARFDARIGLRDATAKLPESDGQVDELRADIQVSTSPLTAVQELKNTAILLRQGKDVPSTYPAMPQGTGAVAVIEDLQETARQLRQDLAVAPAAPSEDAGLALAQLRETAAVLREQEEIAAATQPSTMPADHAPALYVLIEDAVIGIGDNRLEISKAGLTLDWDEMSWRLGPMQANLTLGTAQHVLPTEVRKVNEDMLLVGNADISMTGHGQLLPGPDGRFDHSLNLRAQSPQVLVTNRRLRFTNVRADIAITPAGISFPDNGRTLHGLYGEFYGGAVRATGQVRPKKPVEYAFIIRAADVNMAQFGQAWPAPGEEPLTMAGTGAGRMHVYGTGRIGETSALSNIRGYGDFEVRNGEFYELPVLAQILNSMKQKAGPGTLGYAAGVFDVRQKTVRFNKVAISAPVMGIQGSGQVNFDAEMDLKVVAAPLADWKQNLKKSKVPIVSDVAAELAGGIQKLLNTATGKLLYQFRITGKMGSPKVTPQPVPVLTDDMMQVFAHMLRGGDRLLEEMKR